MIVSFARICERREQAVVGRSKRPSCRCGAAPVYGKMSYWSSSLWFAEKSSRLILVTFATVSGMVDYRRIYLRWHIAHELGCIDNIPELGAIGRPLLAYVPANKLPQVVTPQSFFYGKQHHPSYPDVCCYLPTGVQPVRREKDTADGTD